MESFRVVLAQVAPALGLVEENLALHERVARRAAENGAGAVVFPELSLTGYRLEDQVPDVAVGLDSPVFERLRAAAREIDLLVGFAEEAPGHCFYNSAAYLSGGEVVHVHRKLFPPNYGMFEEMRDFGRGETLRSFDTPHGPAGVLICEDMWHPACSWILAQQGAEVFFALSAGPTRGARPGLEVTSVGVWRRLLRVCAQFQTSFVVYVNRVGVEDGLSFGGGSLVVDPFGRIVAELPALEEGLLPVDLDAELLRRARTAYPLLREERIDLVSRELERVRRHRYRLGDSS